MHILVTGAGGFVGRCVCQHLLLEGLRVRGTYRRDRGALPAGVEAVRIGAVEDFDRWAPALQDVDAVVHLIARTHVMHEREPNPLAKYRAINVTGTERLLSACQRANVARFIFLSSAKALGEGAPTAYREKDRCQPEDPYGTSKREAEQLIASRSGGATRYTILRPPLVYGPRVGGNFARIVHAVRRGIPLPLGSVSNARSMIYVENLADAVGKCLLHAGAAGETFHVADSNPISTRQLVELLSRAMGKTPRLFPAPDWLLRAGGRVVGKVAEVERLVGSLTLSTQHISDTLGWQAPISVEEGIRRTVNSSFVGHCESAVAETRKAA